jgi:hypothetical protein
MQVATVPRVGCEVEYGRKMSRYGKKRAEIVARMSHASENNGGRRGEIGEMR